IGPENRGPLCLSTQMTVDSGETPAFTAAVDRACALLREAIPVWEAQCSLDTGSLPVPDWARERSAPPSVKLFKEFCVGLLENPCCHAWWPALSRVSLEMRTAVSGGLFLLRKVLPSLPSPWEEHAGRVCSPGPTLPVGYLSHVRRTVHRLFPYGWDREYYDAVHRFIPRSSSCLGFPRSVGGARAAWRGLRAEFRNLVSPSGGDSPLPVDEFPAKFMNVLENGKCRSVTVGGADQVLLGPLHKTIYGTLSRNEWLLRGAAKPSAFSGFSQCPGEVFVSGDYESATDNLSLEVAEAILDVLRRKALFVPDKLWSVAALSLRATLLYPGGVEMAQLRGQLMGNYLSFPLLCIQNYCAFRFCVRPEEVSDHLVRINGDDIVFLATREVARRGVALVFPTGLKLSPGKTLVSSSVFSLNSTFFRGVRDRLVPRLIPVLRFGSLGPVRAEMTPHSLAPSLAAFRKGFRGEARVVAEAMWLRWRRKELLATGRSVVRDLRVPVTFEALSRVGMVRRECVALTLPANSLPFDSVRFNGALPPGWTRREVSGRGRRRRARELEEEFWEQVRQRTWDQGTPPKKALAREVWDRTVETGQGRAIHVWLRHMRDWSKAPKLYRPLAKRLRPDLSLLRRACEEDAPRRVGAIWVPDGYSDRVGRWEQSFVPGGVMEESFPFIACLSFDGHPLGSELGTFDDSTLRAWCGERR
ncbi:RNA-dependent RNA polymerase, partial [Rhizoctonia solani ourmia-like virus 1]